MKNSEEVGKEIAERCADDREAMQVGWMDVVRRLFILRVCE